MCESTVSARARVKGRTKRRPAAAAFRGAATGFLTLPFISPNVPARSEHDAGDKEWLQAAMLCAELVGDDELDINDKTTARDIISQSLSAWASKHCADVQVLDKFGLEASLDRDAFYLDYDRSPEKKLLYIGFRSQQTTPFINVKAKVEMLESVCPGLGRTAVSIAEVASYRTFTAFTPQVALHYGSYMYWYGMDNDEDYKEEAESCGEDLEEVGIPMPSQFLTSFPDYLVKGKELKRKALQRIAKGGNEAGETAKVILSIMDLIDQNARLSFSDNFFGEPVYFSCYLGTGDDMLARVVDDFYAHTGESEEYTDMYGVAEVDFDRESFQKWRTEIEKGFALYTQLDLLMRCIGEVQ